MDLGAAADRLDNEMRVTETALKEEREREIAKIKAANPGIWRQLADTWPGRLLKHVWNSAWGKVLTALVTTVLAYLTPPVRRVVDAFVAKVFGTSP